MRQTVHTMGVCKSGESEALVQKTAKFLSVIHHVSHNTMGTGLKSPSPSKYWLAWNSMEQRCVKYVCKKSLLTKFECPQTLSKPVNSFSAVNVTSQFFTRFGIETLKFDPTSSFPINFWPKKFLPNYVLNWQSYAQKKNFFNFWFFFQSWPGLKWK